MKYSIHKIILSFTTILFISSFAFSQTSLDQGIELYKKSNYEGAVNVLKQSVKVNSSDSQAWYFLGLSYLKQNKSKDAEKSLKKAVALNIKDSKIRVALSYAYLLRNNQKEARKEAETVLSQSPNDVEALYILGGIDVREGQYEEAYQKANQAIKISPDFAAAYLLKSESLVSSLSSQPEKPHKTAEEKKVIFRDATESLEKYLSFSPNNEDTKFQEQYLESLKFFSEYYSNPENQKLLTPDADNPSTDTDTTPIKFTAKPRAAYTDKARYSGIQGTIRLLVGFAADGKVRHVLVLKPLGYGLNEEAVRAAFAIKFEPATRDGKPISLAAIVEYNFSIY